MTLSRSSSFATGNPSKILIARRTPSASANSQKPNRFGVLFSGSITLFQLRTSPHASSSLRTKASSTLGGILPTYTVVLSLAGAGSAGAAAAGSAAGATTGAAGGGTMPGGRGTPGGGIIGAPCAERKEVEAVSLGGADLARRRTESIR